ncbi:hypothetical protein MRX96_049889 [Rhipicephalus microplus]
MGEVTKVSATGCKVEFPSSTELIKTVRDPSYHTLGGQRLKFAMGIEPVLAKKCRNVKKLLDKDFASSKRPVKSPPPKRSKGKSSGQNKMTREELSHEENAPFAGLLQKLHHEPVSCRAPNLRDENAN